MNLLIVESKNDKIFIEALIRSMKQSIDLLIDAPICNIDNFECLDGLDETKLKIKIQDILTDVTKTGHPIRKVGILLDLDDKTPADRISLLNTAIEKAFLEDRELTVKALFSAQNQLETVIIDANTQIELACHFTNHNGQGELETVLKAIKTKPSYFADCLEAWRNCLATADKSISQKDFDKFWLANYIRFDTCSNYERKQAERKCSIRNLDFVLENKPDIFDFNDACLSDLRNFLRLFPA